MEPTIPEAPVVAKEKEGVGDGAWNGAFGWLEGGGRFEVVGA